jgi:glycosyltransferase involved in cell wall biosynthesis
LSTDKLPVSVVICALNEEHRIRDTINSARNNNPCEIIVVEGGSLDNTAEVAKKYADRVFSVSNYGLGYKRNYGVCKASQKYILNLDADQVLENGALELMISEVESGNYAGVQATLKSVVNDTYWEKAMEYGLGAIQYKLTNAKIIGTPSLYKADIIKKINFDKKISGSCDDTDLCYRMIGAGHKLGVSTAVCLQKHRGSFKTTIKKFLWYGEGDCEFGLMHKDRLASIFVHPIKNYLFKKSFYAIRNKDFQFVPYFVLIGVTRHLGFYKYLLKKIVGNAKDSRTLNRSDKDY